MPTSLLKDTAQLLQKDFELTVPAEELTEAQLVDLLTPVIHQLLNRDFEKLLQICYRIDLGESKLQQILHESGPEEISKDLAKAFIARQKLKIEIRRKYSGEI